MEHRCAGRSLRWAAIFPWDADVLDFFHDDRDFRAACTDDAVCPLIDAAIERAADPTLKRGATQDTRQIRAQMQRLAWEMDLPVDSFELFQAATREGGPLGRPILSSAELFSDENAGGASLPLTVGCHDLSVDKFDYTAKSAFVDGTLELYLDYGCATEPILFTASLLGGGVVNSFGVFNNTAVSAYVS